jgi:hypothetical protein
MAFREDTLERIRTILYDRGVDFEEKKMFAGVCIMVDGNMCMGTHVDKKSGENMLLARVGDVAYEQALEEPHVIPMNFTGRTMKGFVFVTEEGFRKDKDLKRWVQLCLDFNPLAKSSKKSGKK